MKTILKGSEWFAYLESNDWKSIPYLSMYNSTYKHVQVFKVGVYYFTFGIKKGYKNLSSLKRNIR